MERQDNDFARMILDVVPKAMHSIRTEMRAIGRMDLTVPQFRVFARLNRAPTTNRDLAENIGIGAPAMSRMVDNLVNKGWIKRETGGTDRRQVRLSLTEAGQTKFNQMKEMALAGFAKRIAELDPAKKESLAAGLAVLQELFIK